MEIEVESVDNCKFAIKFIKGSWFVTILQRLIFFKIDKNYVMGLWHH